MTKEGTAPKSVLAIPHCVKTVVQVGSVVPLEDLLIALLVIGANTRVTFRQRLNANRAHRDTRKPIYHRALATCVFRGSFKLQRGAQVAKSKLF